MDDNSVIRIGRICHEHQQVCGCHGGRFFLRTLALPAEITQWSMTTLRERLVKIGAKIVRHGRSVIFQMAEVMIPRHLFQEILTAVAALRPMLRNGARLNLFGCQRDTCVPMQALGPRFWLARRSSTSRQGSSRFPDGITVANTPVR